MKFINRQVSAVALVAVTCTLTSLSQPALAQDFDDPGAGAFVQNCMKCHQGILTGNDLQNTTLSTPESLDATVRRMQQYTGPLTEKQIEDLVELLRDKEVKFRIEEAQLLEEETVAELTSAASTTGAAADGSATTGAAAEAPLPDPDQIALLYNQKCASCHTIGGGNVLAGPDLARVIAWPNATLAAAVKRMEMRVGPLPDDEVNQYVQLLKDPRRNARLAHAKSGGKSQAAAGAPISGTQGTSPAPVPTGQPQTATPTAHAAHDSHALPWDLFGATAILGVLVGLAGYLLAFKMNLRD